MKQTISSTISIFVACDFEWRHEECKEAVKIIELQKNAACQNHEKNILFVVYFPLFFNEFTLRKKCFLVIPDTLVAIVTA